MGPKKKSNKVAYIKVPINDEKQVTATSSQPTEISTVEVQQNLPQSVPGNTENTSNQEITRVSEKKTSLRKQKKPPKIDNNRKKDKKIENTIEETCKDVSRGSSQPKTNQKIKAGRMKRNSNTTFPNSPVKERPLSSITKPPIPITAEDIKEVFLSIDLDPANVRSWSREATLSLLFQECQFSKSEIVLLFNEGFSGSFVHDLLLANLESTEHAKRMALDTFPSIPLSILLTINIWIDRITNKCYHLWTEDMVEKYLSRAGVTGKDLEPFCGLKGHELVPYVHDIWDNSCDIVKFSPNFIKWANSTKIRVKPIFNLLESSNKMSERILEIGLSAYDENHLEFIQKLLVWLQKFEESILEYEDRKQKSKLEFNEKMKTLNLDSEETSIFIYSGSETSASCLKSVCTFAPTYPPNKYVEREAFLGENKVLTFVEAPGTGKTHFGYHLTSTNRLVIPLGPKHIRHLFKNHLCHVQGEGLAKRNLLNDATRMFTLFYQRGASLLHEYGISFIRDSNIEISSAKIKQYVLRYLSNGGGVWIGEQVFKYYSILPECKFNTVWLLDEVQCIDSNNPLIVPRSDSSGDGTMLTLLVSSLRLTGAVVLTTTFFTSVVGNIDKVISKDTGKEVLEKFSFDFSLLPTLNPEQVLQFLEYFIKIEDKEGFMWSYISFFLQGTIRNVESFLQHLFLKTNDEQTNNLGLIYSALHNVCVEKTNDGINRIDEKITNALPSYKYIFYKLAVSGEVNLGDLNLVSALPKVRQFLICDGVSFTIKHEKNIFKLSSCLEKGKMLRHIFDKFGQNWVEEVYKVLVSQSYTQKKDISLLSEVFFIDILINHFDPLILPLFGNSSFTKYGLEAKYYFDDSDTSEIVSNDAKMSSILIQYMAQNFCKQNHPVNMFLSRPGKYARADVLGILTLRDSFQSESLPNTIPLSIAITRKGFKSDGPHEKMVQDFASTDLNNMYNNHIISTNSLNENLFVQDEKSKISSSLEELKNRAKVRLLFHPNQKYSQTLQERIEKGLYNTDTKSNVVTRLTDFSVITDDNSCVIEICSGIEKTFRNWKPFIDTWKKLFGKNRFQ